MQALCGAAACTDVAERLGALTVRGAKDPAETTCAHALALALLAQAVAARQAPVSAQAPTPKGKRA